VQVCGLWPHAVGAPVPLVGVPLGRHLRTGGPVCCDPLSWFRAGLTHNPGMTVLGQTGRGKSTLVRSMALGLAATGTGLLFLGDLKPDYAPLVRALGGQVLDLGRGRGCLNMLDPGALHEAAARLSGPSGEALRVEAVARSADLTVALLEVFTRAPLPTDEEALLRAAVGALSAARRCDAPAPVLAELIGLVAAGPKPLRELTSTRTKAAYCDRAAGLLTALRGFAASDLGASFGSASTVRLDLDGPGVCVDISSLAGGRTDQRHLAAVLLSTWAAGFAGIEAAHRLADAGVGRPRDFLVVLDELWAVLRACPGMVDRVDALTRTNRAEKVANVLVTHSFADLDALPAIEDRAKAAGFVERSGLVATAELSGPDLDRLAHVVGLNAAEREEIASWSLGEHHDPVTGRAIPASRGRFLLKTGTRPGIPVRVHVPPVAADINNTDHRWTTP
jgi:hypothetical protein